MSAVDRAAEVIREWIDSLPSCGCDSELRSDAPVAARDLDADGLLVTDEMRNIKVGAMGQGHVIAWRFNADNVVTDLVSADRAITLGDIIDAYLASRPT